MVVVRAIGIAWVAALLATIVFGSLWPLLLLATLTFMIGVIAVTFRSIIRLPWGLMASGGILFATTLVLRFNPDPVVKTLTVNYYLLGPGILFLSLWAAVISSTIMRTDWGRQHEGLPTIRDLTTIIQNPASHDRAEAVVELGTYEDLKARSTIIQATHDADPAVHELAMLTLLDRIGDRSALTQQAITAAGEPRAVAAANLRMTPLEDRIHLLLSYVQPFRKSAASPYAVNALAELGIVALPILQKDVEAADDDDIPEDIMRQRRQAAAHVLGHLGTLTAPTVPTLISALEHWDQLQRHEYRPVFRWVHTLVSASAYSDRDIHVEIISALGRIGDNRATEPLMERLHEGDPNIRAAAAEALGALGDARALPALEEMAQNDYERDRQQRPLSDIASEAIRRIQSPDQE